MSCVFFTKIWHDLEGEPAIARLVCRAILGNDGTLDSTADEQNLISPECLPLVNDIIASAPADADRMDYLERDSRAIGVTYGLFDRNRILKSLLCYRDRNSTALRLGVKQSGLRAIENLMQARYELFVQVYFHKSNRAISLMLEGISHIAAEQVNLFGEPPSLETLEKRYVELSDEHFMRVLCGDGLQKIPDSAKKLARDIWGRKLWKRILDPSDKAVAHRVLEFLQMSFPGSKDLIKEDENRPRALKDLDRGAALLIRNAGGVYEASTADPWTRKSPIIRALKEADETFVGIYFHSTDGGKAKSIRDKALEFLAPRGGIHASS